MSPRRALFALLLFCPLAEIPGTGFDGLRLPFALAAGAALLALGPLSRPGRAGAALLALLALQALSLAATSDLDAGLRALLVAAAGAAAYAVAREAGEGVDVPLVLGAVVGVLLAVAIVQRWRGQEVVSLLGNSNYAGALAAMLIPVLLGGGKLGRLGAAGAALLLALSGSRGGLLGAAAGVSLTAAILWRASRRREAVGMAALFLVAGSLAVAVKPRSYLSAERMDTAKVRLEIWKASMRLAADRPFLGTGAGGFGAAFPPYRGEGEARIAQRDAGRSFREVEDAHSSWVQALAEGGIPGLLAWIWMAVAAARLAWRAGPERAGWAGAAAAFLVAGFFNTLSAHAAHAVLFGVALGRLEGPGLAPLPRPPAWTAAALLAAGAIWTSSLLPSDLAYHRALVLEDPAAREAAARQAEGWRARYQLGVELDRQGRHAEAVDAYREALRDRPFHGAALNNLAVASLRAGRPRAEAEAALARALEVAPHYAMTHFHLGLLRLQDRRPPEARAHFEKAAALNEKHGASRYGIGETYLAEGDVPGALTPLRRARETGFDVGAALRRDHPATAGDPRLAEFH